MLKLAAVCCVAVVFYFVDATGLWQHCRNKRYHTDFKPTNTHTVTRPFVREGAGKQK